VTERSLLEAVKITALSDGVAIDQPTLASLGGPDALTIHEYATTGGVTLRLPEAVLVNAPFDHPTNARSPLRLLGTSDDGFLLDHPEGQVAVEEVLPLPGFLDVRDGAGELIRDRVMSHADRLRVSPIVGCAYDCTFCDLATVPYRRRPTETLLEAIDLALAHDVLPVRHLLISGGTPGPRDTHQEYFTEVCEDIARHVGTRPAPPGFDRFEVDLMMSPRPDGPAFVDRVVDAGITGFSINLEVYAEDAAMRHIPRKHQQARRHLEATVSRAVERVGVGAVRSLIVVGLEPLETTLDGIRWLTSLGCEPVLSPFRPAPDTALADAPPVDGRTLEQVLDGARTIVEEAGVDLGPGCVPCQHNTLTLPWDVRSAATA
jgi:hypothetical protein